MSDAATEVNRNALELIAPDWPAPDSVRAYTTTRRGGVSAAPFASLNLSRGDGDADAHVAENRSRLARALDLAAEPAWIRQVHGAKVARAEGRRVSDPPPTADASISHPGGHPCVVLTADCIPVLLCRRDGTRVAAAHAGWRGLAGGVLEATVRALDAPPDQVLAWLGPGIGPAAYEVGDEIRDALLRRDADHDGEFRLSRPGHWLADLYAIARRALTRMAVHAVFGGDRCTHSDPDRFFSHRRDGHTGRIASLIWVEPGIH